MKTTLFLLSIPALFLPASLDAGWPALHGNVQHTGFVQAELKPPFRVAWVREIEGERLGTAVEPIVDGGKVFLGTHAGNIYALNAETGEALWRFQAHGAFLQSPAAADGLVIAASADGNLYALDAESGKPVWNLHAARGGFSASPAIAEGMIYLGTRAGDFLGVNLKTGKETWRRSLGIPILQTAAVADGKIFVTAEDLRVRSFQAGDGDLLWISEQLAGQTARDYYPIVVRRDGRAFVVVRTNPALNMGRRIGRDRTMLCRNAGVDDSGWQKVDAWTKSDAAVGTPDLWEKEQKAIIEYLERDRDAQSFFILDAATGQPAMTAPVLWVSGCQAVGAQPALTSDGRLVVFYRTAYGHWTHGVAPLVGLGLLDLGENRIAPLSHAHGKQPRWNTFWGTADESQNFVVAGDLILIVHQGTLSGFDLKKNELFAIAGHRDTFGGFPSPPWARNEWHGPGRGGVAVAADRIYWQTGSRVLCLSSGSLRTATLAVEPGGQTKSVEPLPLEMGSRAIHAAPKPPRPDAEQLRQELTASLAEVISKTWAPLFTDPGLAGRDFSFDDTGELFEALAWACPHLPAEWRKKTKAYLAEAWSAHPPFTKEGWLSLKEGAPREWFRVPEDYRSRLGADKPPHPFANVYPSWLYAQRCAEENRVLQSWPQIKAAFDDFVKSGWQLDGGKGDLYANRYLSSLIAFGGIAEKKGDTAAAGQAKAKATETADALVLWWKRAAGSGTLQDFKGSGELDPFIGKGDGISFRVAPHRHKVALLSDLSPEVAEWMKTGAPEAVERVWETFEYLYRTWPLVGEERQVHFGENFVDPPDLALGGFKAAAWLRGGTFEELGHRVDLPFCRADLYHLTKLAIALDAR